MVALVVGFTDRGGLSPGVADAPPLTTPLFTSLRLKLITTQTIFYLSLSGLYCDAFKVTSVEIVVTAGCSPS